MSLEIGAVYWTEHGDAYVPVRILHGCWNDTLYHVQPLKRQPYSFRAVGNPIFCFAKDLVKRAELDHAIASLLA